MKLSQSARKISSVSEIVLSRQLGSNIFLISEVNNSLLKMVVTFNLKFSEIIKVPSFFFLLRFLNHKAYSLGLMQAYFFSLPIDR